MTTIRTPTLILTSGPNVNVPTFEIDPGDPLDPIVNGDTITLFTSFNGGAPSEYPVVYASTSINFATGPLADGPWEFWITHARTGFTTSDISNVESETIDTVAPTVLSRSPADNATGVAFDTDIIITFSEPVFLGTSGTITLKKTSDDSTVDSWDVATDEGVGAGQLEVLNDDELYLHPTTNLAWGLEVYLVWQAGVVEDAAANGVAVQSSTTVHSFVTAFYNFTIRYQNHIRSAA